MSANQKKSEKPKLDIFRYAKVCISGQEIQTKNKRSNISRLDHFTINTGDNKPKNLCHFMSLFRG